MMKLCIRRSSPCSSPARSGSRRARRLVAVQQWECREDVGVLGGGQLENAVSIASTTIDLPLIPSFGLGAAIPVVPGTSHFR